MDPSLSLPAQEKVISEFVFPLTAGSAEMPTQSGFLFVGDPPGVDVAVGAVGAVGTVVVPGFVGTRVFVGSTFEPPKETLKVLRLPQERILV